MSNCQRCKSGRTVFVSGKCADRFFNSITENPSYVPTDMNIGYESDYLEFEYCLDCGQIQGNWPLPQTQYEKEMAK